jgi:hypothetical protein
MRKVVINNIYLRNNFETRPEDDPLIASYTLEGLQRIMPLRTKPEALRRNFTMNSGRMAVPAVAKLIPSTDPEVIRSVALTLQNNFREPESFASGVEDALVIMKMEQAA